MLALVVMALGLLLMVSVLVEDSLIKRQRRKEASKCCVTSEQGNAGQEEAQSSTYPSRLTKHIQSPFGSRLHAFLPPTDTTDTSTTRVGRWSTSHTSADPAEELVPTDAGSTMASSSDGREFSFVPRTWQDTGSQTQEDLVSLLVQSEQQNLVSVTDGKGGVQTDDGGEGVKMLKRIKSAYPEQDFQFRFLISLQPKVRDTEQTEAVHDAFGVQMVPGFPDWNAVADQSVLEQWCEHPASVRALRQGCVLSRSRRVVRIKVAPLPFSKGSGALVFHAFYASRGTSQVPPIVLKRSHGAGGSADPITDSDVEDESERLAILDGLCRAFNERLKRMDRGGSQTAATGRLKFMQKRCACMLDSQTMNYVYLEPFLHGHFTDLGRASDSGKGPVPPFLSSLLETFAHWTYTATQGYLMVADPEIVKVDEQYWLKNPFIHSEDNVRFSRRNGGRDGIQHFMKAHKCNDICRHLKLEKGLAKRLNDYFQKTFRRNRSTQSLPRLHSIPPQGTGDKRIDPRHTRSG